MLGLESRESILVLDDALARRVAVGLGLRLTGTLGILLSAKRAGLVSAMTPQLDRLQALRFHVAPQTRAAVLTLAGES
jgi:predicted nucleic acid-binding protein